MSKEKLTYAKPSAGNFNLMSYPKILKEFQQDFELFNWKPSEVNVEWDRVWSYEFRRMEDGAEDYGSWSVYDNMLSIIIDTAKQFYLRGYIEGRDGRQLYRKESTDNE